MQATYMGDKEIAARVGDVIIAPGSIRGIVIGVQGEFVTMLRIGTSQETGDTFVHPQRHVQDFLASQCSYPDKQTLNV